jgi:integrase
VATTFQHLNGLLEAAADDGLIARNPARGVKLPARGPGEVVPPTVEQVAALYDKAPDWFQPTVLLGAGLGLRHAEVSGLTVDRVLWLERAVRVDRQWVTRRGLAEFAPPKTASSVRTIPASQWVLDGLAAHVGRRHDGFVLHRDGDPVDHNAFDYRWRQTAKAAGVEGLRYHALRHAFASMLVSAGCSVRAVQHALGPRQCGDNARPLLAPLAGRRGPIRQAVDRALADPAEDSVRTAGTER